MIAWKLVDGGLGQDALSANLYWIIMYQKVCTMKEFDENGEKKRIWYKAGYIKTTDQGGKYLVMYGQPDTSFYIFDEDDEMQ